MTEEEARKLKAQAREFPETMALLTKVRTGMAEMVFKTSVMDTKSREEIFLRVMTLDALIAEMGAILTSVDGDKAVQAYLDKLEAGAKPKTET